MIRPRRGSGPRLLVAIALLVMAALTMSISFVWYNKDSWRETKQKRTLLHMPVRQTSEVADDRVSPSVEGSVKVEFKDSTKREDDLPKRASHSTALDESGTRFTDESALNLKLEPSEPTREAFGAARTLVEDKIPEPVGGRGAASAYGITGGQSISLEPPPLPAGVNEPVRLFHVTNNGTTVEGGMFVRFASIRRKNKSYKYYDPLMWKRIGCGMTHMYLKGGCYWCSTRDPSICSQKGRFLISEFKDDHKGYSLQSRGVSAIIGMFFSPTKNGTRNGHGKAEFDSVYATCDSLVGILENEPGVLLVEKTPDFVVFVSPYRPNASSIMFKKRPNIVCTKAFYGTGINTRTVMQFVHHYLENWGFDAIVMYELGTTVSRKLQDVILEEPRLQQYQAEGRILLFDLKDELQRLYGPIAGDIVLFSSKNGQMIVSADCLSRAKLMNAEWVLPIDWDEILMLGADHGLKDIDKTKHPTRFTEWISEKNRVRRSSIGTQPMMVLVLNRIITQETSICSDCQSDTWDERGAMQYHLEHEKELLKATLSAMDGTTTTMEGDEESSAPGEKVDPIVKYAVRVRDHIYPLSRGYGIHVMSHCSYNMNRKESYTMRANVTDLYLRHYKCMNKRSPCDKARLPVLNWGLGFGDLSKLEKDDPEMNISFPG